MRFDFRPHLIGTLVELRPLAPADWDALYAVASDPEIWALHPARDRWQEPVFREFFGDALRFGAEGSGGAFAVIDRATGEVVGSTRYFVRPEAPDEVEIGWTFLARRCWGGAYNGEMKRLMIDHALRSFPRVVFVVGEDNARSQRALEKIGAVRCGFVERADRSGKMVRRVEFEVRRPSG